MHILIAIIGIIGAVSVWYWRLKTAQEAARGLGEAARTAANLPRRMAFLSKSRKGGARLIEDPREAASVMMVLVSEQGGLVRERHHDIMIEAAADLFEFDADEAEALFAHAAWAIRSDAAAHAIMGRMASVILKSDGVGPKDLVDLDGVLVALSEAGGAPSGDQMRLIQIFRDKSGIKA